MTSQSKQFVFKANSVRVRELYQLNSQHKEVWIACCDCQCTRLWQCSLCHSVSVTRHVTETRVQCHYCRVPYYRRLIIIAGYCVCLVDDFLWVDVMYYFWKVMPFKLEFVITERLSPTVSADCSPQKGFMGRAVFYQLHVNDATQQCNDKPAMPFVCTVYVVMNLYQYTCVEHLCGTRTCILYVFNNCDSFPAAMILSKRTFTFYYSMDCNCHQFVH